MAEVSFGEWLRRQRKAGGFTQEQLARQIHCSTSTLKKLESEERRPSEQIVLRLAEIYNIPENENTHFLRFARGDWRFAPAGAVEDAPWRTLSVPPRSNLPVPLTSFIGREREVEEVVRLLGDHRLVVLTGPGGIGKTRLAMESASKSAHTLRDGVQWVDLVDLDDSSLVPQAVSQAVNVRGIPNHPLMEALVERLRSTEILLVLDNCEHLIAACAQVADRLLGACPRLKILATSREAFNIPGETSLPITSLSLPGLHGPFTARTARQFESVRLFADRAASVQPGFELTDQNAKGIAEICRHVDGMPLAIELAAARAKIMSVDEMAKRLDDRFGLLISGSRTAAPRHQTLRATIQWSHDLLTDPERNLFRRLAVFVGGFTLQALETVCSQGMEHGDTLNLLGRLVDKSLVTVQHTSPTGETRYRLLETIRQYALERLEDAGEMTGMRDRHLAYYIELAEQSEPHIWGRDVASWAGRLDAELDNFRTAMDWAVGAGEEVGALRMIRSLVYYWLEHDDLLSEWYTLIQRALSSPGGREHTLVRAEALNAIGFFSWPMSYLLDKRPELEEALRIGREIGDQWTIACALRNLGLDAMIRGSYAEARTLLEESLVIWRTLEPSLKVKIGTSLALLYRGEVAIHQGELEVARPLVEECVHILREQGEKNYLAYGVRRLALLAVREGDYQRAEALIRESLVLNYEIGDYRGVIASLVGCGGIAAAQERYARAARLVAAAGSQSNAIGLQLLRDDKMEYEANLALQRRQLDQSALEGYWEEGKSMTMEQAIEYALEESGG